MSGEKRQGVFADELVACIANGREPSVHELFSLARRVWVESAAERSAFGWDRLPSTHEERLYSLRAAHAALAGSAGDVHDS